MISKLLEKKNTSPPSFIQPHFFTAILYSQRKENKFILYIMQKGDFFFFILAGFISFSVSTMIATKLHIRNMVV